MTAFEEICTIALNFECIVEKNALMSEYTSFKIGGPATLLIKPDSIEKTSVLLRKCREFGLPVFILGCGSNILIPDEGYDGVVIYTGEIDYIINKGNGEIECGAGSRLSSLCKYALSQGLSGLEFAYGIPGSAGGAAYMNAGAYGGEMKDVLLACDHLLDDGGFGTFKKEDLAFGYRTSVYKTNGFLIAALRLQLFSAGKTEIETKMNDVMNRRKDKQPLDLPSAGSVFKRPKSSYAGELIEACGLKGFRIGDAMVSPKHAGFIVNLGQATAGDVKALIKAVQDRVFKNTSVLLETEIVFV